MELVIYGGVMLIAMTLAGVIGFAANVLALPVLSLFLPLKTAVAVLILIVTAQLVIQAFQMRKRIRWKEVGHIVFWLILGMPLGFVALNYLSELFMKGLLGAFVAVTAIKGIIDEAKGKKKDTFKEQPYHKLLLFLSGILTGAFGCGGPLMVLYCKNRYRDKETFRLIQFGAGSIIMLVSCLAYIGAGAFNAEGVPYIIVGFITVAVALKVSAVLAQRLKTEWFQQLVNVVLLISAATLLWQVAQKLIA